MNKSIIRFVGLAVLLTAAAIAGADSAAPERYVVPLSRPGQPASLKVDLMFGTVTVTGVQGNEVIVEAKPRTKSLRINERMPDVERIARDAARAARIALEDSEVAAKKEAKDKSQKAAGLKSIPLEGMGLTIEEEANEVSVGAEGWRQSYDLDIKVPIATSISINGANLDDITVQNISGEIEVETANGNVKLAAISGTAVVESTNGEIEVILNRVTPGKPMSFVTFNGDIDVTLPADTKANIRIKSDNGEVFTDFDMALRQAPAEPQKIAGRQGSKYRISLERSLFGTINGGGPEFKFQNYQGNVYLRKK